MGSIGLLGSTSKTMFDISFSNGISDESKGQSSTSWTERNDIDNNKELINRILLPPPHQVKKK